MSDHRYDEKSAARILKIHPDSLRRLRRQGRITFYRTGTGRISYKFDDLMAFGLNQRVQAAPQEASAKVHPFPSPAA